MCVCLLVYVFVGFGEFVHVLIHCLVASSVGMVSKPVQDTATEFHISQEEFPALPGATSKWHILFLFIRLYIYL